MTAPSKRPAGRFDALLVAGCSLVVFAIAHRHAFLSPYIVNDDVRQQLFWMARWCDPALYPPDLLSAYAAAYVPVGVKAVYTFGVRLLGIDPLLCSKLVTGLLFTVLAVAMRGIGATLGDRRLGFACAAMVWLLPFFLKNLSGGLSRAFAAPLLALFVLGWLRRDAVTMAATLVATAVLSPYMAVVCAGSACLDAVFARCTRRAGPAFPARAWHLAVLALAAGAVLAFNRSIAAAGFGPLAWGRDLVGRPEFTAAGRLDLFPLPNPFFDLVYWPFESIGLFLDIGLFTGVASLAVLLPVLIRGWRRTPWAALLPKLRPLAMLLAGSLVLYLAARIVALALFVPDRYVTYTINLLYALGLAVCLRHAFSPLIERRWGAALLLVLAAGLGAWRLTGDGLYDYRDGAPLYAAVRALPKDARVAGNPEVMDNVLTFGRRNVLASFELAHPWSVGYWRRFAPRLADAVEAYYAKDARTVVDVARRDGITHFVVREGDFTPETLRKGPLFAPYNARIRELAAAPGQFALLDGAQFPYTRLAPDLRLVDMRPFTARPSAPPPEAP